MGLQSGPGFSSGRLSPRSSQANTDAHFERVFQHISVLRDSLRSVRGSSQRSTWLPPLPQKAAVSPITNASNSSFMEDEELGDGTESQENLKSEFGEFSDEVVNLRRMRRVLKNSDAARNAYQDHVQDKMLVMRMERLRLEQ